MSGFFICADLRRFRMLNLPFSGCKNTIMDNEEKDKGGRPSEFRPEYIEQAEKLCRLGATDAEMAEFFEVSVRTLHRWKAEHEEFCHSIKVGKEHADSRVERALYEKATGFAYVEDQAIKVRNADGSEMIEIVKLEKQAPPDTPAMIFWLKNRKKADWRDKVENELTGANGGPLVFEKIVREIVDPS